MRFKAMLLALLIVSVLTAQSNSIDHTINAFLDRWKIKGASVAITKDAKLIYNKGFGFADERRSEKVSSKSLFRIASVSKSITAIAVMKLVEEGKLSLDDKVFGKGEILEESYYYSAIHDKRIYSITVKHLLEHTSGWDREKPCDGYSHSDPAFYPLHVTEVMNEANPVGDSTLIKFSLLRGIHHQPGTYYSYSNVGYLVLGKIIEKISGQKYEEYVREKLLAPAGITNFYLGKNLKRDKQKHEVSYYGNNDTRSVYGDGKKVAWQYGGFNLEAMNAHGGWIASAEEITRLLLTVDESDEIPDILNKQSLGEMGKGSTANKNYGKGWMINSENTWWHTGSLDGSASFVCRTSNGYTWAFLFNSRADNSEAFWREFDRLPWGCIKDIEAQESKRIVQKNTFTYSDSLNVAKSR